MIKKVSLLTLLQGINKTLRKVEVIFMTIGCFVLVGTVIVSVISRYLLYIPTPWADEFSRYLFLWLAFIGMAYVTSEWNHIDVQLIDTFLNKTSNPEKALKTVIKVSQVLSLVVLVLSTMYYFKYFTTLYPSVSPAMGIPLKIPYSSPFIGLLLMDFHCIYVLIMPEKLANDGISN